MPKRIYPLSSHHTVNGDCWDWKGPIDKDGYGHLYRDGKNIRVPRQVFYETNGFYPPVVRHTCDRPICIKPTHLIAGTTQDNMKDRARRHRTHNAIKVEQAKAIFDRRKEGKTYSEIANEMNLKIKRVEYILTRWSKGQEKFVE